MANTINIDSYAPENKWSPAITRVSDNDSFKPLTRSVQFIQLETFHVGTPKESYGVSIELAGSSDNERKLNAQHACALLAAAGFNQTETKTRGPHMSIEINNAGGKNALVTVAHALGRNLDGASGNATDAMLDSKVIHAIERHYLDTTGLKPSEAGLISIRTDVRDAERHALYGTSGQHIAMVDVTLPHGVIAAIREDVLPIGNNGVNTVEVRTDVTIRDWASQGRVMEALNARGLKATLFTDKDVAYVHVPTTADQVAQALAAKEIMPPYIAQDIALHVLAAHPDVQAGFVARISRNPKATAELPEADAPNADAPRGVKTNKREELAAYAVRRFLLEKLRPSHVEQFGEALVEQLSDSGVFETARVKGGYHITVPHFYSHTQLGPAGIDVSRVKRQRDEAGTHFLMVPDEALPEELSSVVGKFIGTDSPTPGARR